MSVVSRRLSFPAALLLLVPAVGSAQQTPAGGTPARPTAGASSAGAARAITPADISSWKMIRGATLSNDGTWFGYLLAPNEGDAEVILRQTASNGKEYRFAIGEPPAAGPGGTGVQLSGDGKWAAFLTYPKAADQKRMRRERRPVQAKATLVNLATGEKREFEKIRRIAFSGESPKWVALQVYAAGQGAPAAAAPAGPGAAPTPPVDGSDLLLHQIGTDVVFNVGNVGDFAFDDKGRWIAYTIDARDRLGNGVQLRDLASGVVQSIDADKAIYRRLAWTDTLPALAFLKGVPDSAGTDTTWAAHGVARVGTSAMTRAHVGLGSKATLPTGMEASPERTPRWTEAMDGLVFGLRVAMMPVPRSELLEDDDRPTLMLWHGKDPRLQSMQQVQENADKSFSFLATYWPASNTVAQLTDDVVRTGVLTGRDRWLVGYDNTRYERQTNLDGIQRRDVYAVNPRTGERKLLKADARSQAQPSPDGRSILLWDDGNWQVMDIATGKLTNITKGAPVSFVDTEDDHNVVKPPTQPI